MKQSIFTDFDLQKSKEISENPFSKLSSPEIKELAIVWCYYSGKIEGNTYDLVDTESLLKDNITAEKSYEDAKMLKNLYNTFISCVEAIKKDGSMANKCFNNKNDTFSFNKRIITPKTGKYK